MAADSPIARPGAATELGRSLTVLGAQLAVGDVAPPFTLEWLPEPDDETRTVSLSDTAGDVRLLHVVLSIDTPICFRGLQRFDEINAAELPADVHVYTVSMDLPFAQARMAQGQNQQHRSLSAHQDDHFGIDYGVLIDEWRLLQRSVFVIGRDDRIAHVEYVVDQIQEPDYTAAVGAARGAAGR
jgi:thiol peroxidase